MDPIHPATWNQYAYVHGDPVNFSDPAGTSEASGYGCAWTGEEWGCGWSAEAAPLPRILSKQAPRLDDRYVEGMTEAGATTYIMGKELHKELGKFSNDCYGQISDRLQISPEKLWSDADKLRFYNANGSAGYLTLREATGLSLGSQGGTTLRDFAASYTKEGATATTVGFTATNGTVSVSSAVILTSSFWVSTGADSFQVLVHELLHYSSQEADVDLARDLLGTSTTDLWTASRALNAWVADCFHE